MKDFKVWIPNKNRQRDKIKLGGVFNVECIDKDGKTKWVDKAENLVVDEGLNKLLDVMFHAVTAITTWYIGLTGGTPSPAAGDTLASHAGWTEVTTTVTAGNRLEWTEGAASSKQITNATSVDFTINDTGTVGGAFLASAASGTEGTLFCCAAFTQGNKSVSSGDTLKITYTLTAADDGA